MMPYLGPIRKISGGYGYQIVGIPDRREDGARIQRGYVKVWRLSPTKEVVDRALTVRRAREIAAKLKKEANK